MALIDDSFFVNKKKSSKMFMCSGLHEEYQLFINRRENKYYIHKNVFWNYHFYVIFWHAIHYLLYNMLYSINWVVLFWPSEPGFTFHNFTCRYIVKEQNFEFYLFIFVFSKDLVRHLLMVISTKTLHFLEFWGGNTSEMILNLV